MTIATVWGTNSNGGGVPDLPGCLEPHSISRFGMKPTERIAIAYRVLPKIELSGNASEEAS